MTENIKTISFATAAAAMVGVSLLMYLLSMPGQMREFEKVGQEFYDDFKDPDHAVTLEVASMGDDGLVKRFVIQKRDGMWRIPSHHGYPVDDNTRLAETATSFIGLMRQSVADLSGLKHEEFGVLDPKSNDPDEPVNPERTGKRITMLDENGETLLDLIVGDKIDPEQKTAGANSFTSNRGDEDIYYVRRPDEKETYRTALNVNLSTRFADWIDTDLMKIDDERITRVSLDRYQLKEQAFRIGNKVVIQNDKVEGEKIELSRSKVTDDWTMAGLDESKEELKTFEASRIAANFTDIEIKGVRPKITFQGQQILTPDLKLVLPPEIVESNPQQVQEIVEMLQTDLQQKGFVLDQNPQTQELLLISTKGEFVASTDNGVVYRLNFGEAFVGDEQAVQIGGDPSETSTQKDAGNVKDKSGKISEDKHSTGDGSNESSNSQADEVAQNEQDSISPKGRNRYLMVRVDFDKALLGEAPTEPQPPDEPAKPVGYNDWITAQMEQEGPDPSGNDDKNVDDSNPPELPENVQSELDEQEKLFKQYQADLDLFLVESNLLEQRKKEYRESRREYRKRLRDGRRKVQKLNERFGEWYYVISDEVFESLQITRADLVTEKTELGEAGTPGIDFNRNPPTVPLRPEIDFKLDDADDDRQEKLEND